MVPARLRLWNARGVKLLKRGVALAMLAMSMCLVGSAQAEPDDVYPNMPFRTGGGAVGSGTTANSLVVPSAQWVRLRTVVAAEVTSFTGATTLCQRFMPIEECAAPPGTVGQRVGFFVRAYPITYATPLEQSTFTEFPPVQVQTVAFGTIPVRATVKMRLPLDDEGLPIGLTALTVEDIWPPGSGPCPSAHCGEQYKHTKDTPVTGAVDIQLASLEVDGVSVDVGESCWARGGRLDLTGKGYTRPDNRNVYDPGWDVPRGKYNAYKGGTLEGTLDVPAFKNCGAGDDLSRLVSNVASGTSFPVKIFQDYASLVCFGLTPAVIKPDQCEQPADLPFPSRD